MSMIQISTTSNIHITYKCGINIVWKEDPMIVNARNITMDVLCSCQMASLRCSHVSTNHTKWKSQFRLNVC